MRYVLVALFAVSFCLTFHSVSACAQVTAIRFGRLAICVAASPHDAAVYASESRRHRGRDPVVGRPKRQHHRQDAWRHYGDGIGDGWK